MCKVDDGHTLCLVRTQVFSVLARRSSAEYEEQVTRCDKSIRQHRDITTKGTEDDIDLDASVNLPLIDLAALLLHQHRQTTEKIRAKLSQFLREFGFVFLTNPKGGARTNLPSRLVAELRVCINTCLFPSTTHEDVDRGSNHNLGNLTTSDTVYHSERGVAMYRLGYEHCEDGVREIFRVAAGNPDAVTWPERRCLHNTRTEVDVDNQHHRNTRHLWLQGSGLMRHVCDTALDLLLLDQNDEDDGKGHSTWWTTRGSKRRYSGGTSWTQPDRYIRNETTLVERAGDYSVLYAMHYFNEAESCVEPGLAVKSHVDPSLLVLEPFLCHETTGLQVWDRHNQCWLDCDGPHSPVSHLWEDHEVMLLFVGKALASALPSMEPTLHRVVTGDCSRRTIIYEQKYEEFYPPPTLD